MSAFADELLRRISDAREALRLATEADELYTARVYTGELESLYRLAFENGIPIPAQPASPAESPPPEQG